MNRLLSIRSSTAIAGLVLSALCFSTPLLAGPNDSNWVKLWNGKDLNDWDIKFTGSALNVNLNNTVKIVDSSISIDYTGWTGWAKQYGHIGYKVKPFSFYLLRVEYQVGLTQVPGGEPWAVQNNGMMLHSQSVSSMELRQDFPISMEAQLLGAGNVGADPTNNLNLCTPGTAFYNQPTGGSVNPAHCVPASNKNRPAPNVWAWASFSVMGDSIIRHYSGPSPTGTPAFTYYRPVYYSGMVLNPPDNTPANGTRITGGYITIQAESHPFKFRKIELLSLIGCMTQDNANFKSYYIRHDAADCATTGLGNNLTPWPKDFSLVGNNVLIRQPGEYSLEVLDLSGKLIRSLRGSEAGSRALSVDKPGVYLVRLQNASGAFTQRAALL